MRALLEPKIDDFQRGDFFFFIHIFEYMFGFFLEALLALLGMGIPGSLYFQSKC